MNEKQEIRAKALEISALIIGKTGWPHEGSAVISGGQRVQERNPRPFDEIFMPYHSIALLIERDICEATGDKTSASG
jgi:hypothetical protein